jgi:hypothetical protein
MYISNPTARKEQNNVYNNLWVVCVGFFFEFFCLLEAVLWSSGACGTRTDTEFMQT